MYRILFYKYAELKMTHCFVLIVFIFLISSAFRVENIPQDVIPVLYKEYKEAVDNAINDNTMSLRRIFKNNKEYKIHVKKLREVNGFKRHNLLLGSELPGKSLIYVNNPVEIKIPHAYLSLEEFKQLLTDRVSRQREKFNKHHEYKPSLLPTRTTLNQKVTNTRKLKHNMKVTKYKQITFIDTYNRPPIQNTQKLAKSEHKTTIKAIERISHIATVNTKDIIKNLTQINIVNFTTMPNKTAVNTKSTRSDEELNDTNKVDIEPIPTVSETVESTVTSKLVDTATGFTPQPETTQYTDTKSMEKSTVTETFVTETEETTSVTTTTKPTRRTLSRPLVFMGGYNK
ncbi:uncharacterized protein LOC115445234 [Manduca sexta]|uniref:uncharacterized protein LOC115445234 n=1 Tax=Manduca sexta TaxID=7130 RepID=UPI001182040A|nr:uncharacterized protein LOC115445234 [Manduca sexta]